MRKYLNFSNFLRLGALGIILTTGYALYATFSSSYGKVAEEISKVTVEEIEQIASFNPPVPEASKSEAKKELLIATPPLRSSKTVITLGKKNTLVFKDVVTRKSVGILQKQAWEMSNKLSPSDEIFLVLETPGGSVDAGMHAVDFLRALPQKVNTITLFAASMGFHMVQSLDQRLITPGGTLMSHRMSIRGLAGEVPGEAVVAMNHALRLAHIMDESASKRMGMPVNNYRELIRDEWWVLGQDAVMANAADKTVLLRCGKDLNGTYDQEIESFFGSITLTWSECPLIAYPLKVDLSAVFKFIDELSKRDPSVLAKKREIAEFIQLFIYNKNEFVRRYINSGAYSSIVEE